jgi:hypothetical protein
VLVAAACGDSGSGTERGATSTTERNVASTTNATSSAERAAVQAYNAMWADMAIAARTSDYQSQRIEQHAAGDALAQLSRGLYANKQHGIVVLGKPTTSPTAVSSTPDANPTSVAISDCLDGTHWLNHVATSGELQNDTPGARHATTATVALTNGSWKVTELAVGQDGSC